MSITGEPAGEPMKVGVSIADLMSGMYAAVAILAAVRHRHLTGEGQHVDISMLDAHVAWLANQGMNYLATGENPPRLGNQHPNIVPYQVMPAADGYFVLSVANDPAFERFSEVADCRHLLEDARFATAVARVRNRDLVTETLNDDHSDPARRLVAREAGGGRCRQRCDQHPGGSVRGPAGQGARDGRRDGPPRNRRPAREAHREPHQALLHPGHLPPGARPPSASTPTRSSASASASTRPTSATSATAASSDPPCPPAPSSWSCRKCFSHIGLVPKRRSRTIRTRCIPAGRTLGSRRSKSAAPCAKIQEGFGSACGCGALFFSDFPVPAHAERSLTDRLQLQDLKTQVLVAGARTGQPSSGMRARSVRSSPRGRGALGSARRGECATAA